MRNAVEIMNDMLHTLGYDPEKRVFSMKSEDGGRTYFSPELLDHSALEKAVRFAEEWSPDLALLYMAGFVRDKLGTETVAVGEVLENPDVLIPWRKLKGLSEEAAPWEDALIRSFGSALSDIGGVRMIGDIKNALPRAAEELVDGLNKLKFEAYSVSGSPMSPPDKFSPGVLRFGSLAECLLTLEKSPDLGAVCRIGEGIETWFGYFFKSGRDIFSMNDRTIEQYKGQYDRPRNDRHITCVRAYGLFPYGGGLDSPAECLKACAGLWLASRKHAGETLKNPVVTDALLARNTARLSQGALVKYQGSSLMKKDVDVSFDHDKFMSGGYDREFSGQGVFDGWSQWLVDMYGEGFQYEDKDLLVSDSSRLLIGEQGHEFIADESRMRAEAYYELRKRLADHIQNKLYREYQDFGGSAGMDKWFSGKLAENKDEIWARMVPDMLKAYEDMLKNIEENRTAPTGDRLCPKEVTGSKRGDGYLCLARQIRGSWRGTPGSFKTPWDKLTNIEHMRHGDIGEWACAATGVKASLCFRFTFDTVAAVERFLGCGLPRFCKCWKRDYWHDHGNPLSDMSDPVARVESPLEGIPDPPWGKKDGYWFIVNVHLSKSGINAMKKSTVK
ncbi:MAG: hypothetical protein J6Y62_04005 [Clostridia bacterium]|nr:hypothetical protein [Clostridia bacterium]